MRPSREAKPAAILRTIETVAPFFSVRTAVTTPELAYHARRNTNADARRLRAINAGSRISYPEDGNCGQLDTSRRSGRHVADLLIRAQNSLYNF